MRTLSAASRGKKKARILEVPTNQQLQLLQLCLQLRDVSTDQKHTESSPSVKHSANNGKAGPLEMDSAFP